MKEIKIIFNKQVIGYGVKSVYDESLDLNLKKIFFSKEQISETVKNFHSCNCEFCSLHTKNTISNYLFFLLENFNVIISYKNEKDIFEKNCKIKIKSFTEFSELIVLDEPFVEVIE